MYLHILHYKIVFWDSYGTLKNAKIYFRSFLFALQCLTGSTMKLSRKTICLGRLVRDSGQIPCSPKTACELEGNRPSSFLLNDVWGFRCAVICLENQVLAVWAINSLVTLTFQTSPKHAWTVNQSIKGFKAKSLTMPQYAVRHSRTQCLQGSYLPIFICFIELSNRKLVLFGTNYVLGFPEKLVFLNHEVSGARN